MRSRYGRGILLTLAAAGLLLAGCGPAAEDSPPAGTDADEPAPDDEDEAPDEDAPDTDGDTDLDEAIALARADAADERGVAEEDLEVVRAEEVNWPDSARGCPEEGKMYTQAIVPGYLIVLSDGEEELHYHGGAGEAPFYCEDPQEPAAE